jgi:serine/threonine protein kinase
MASRRSGTPHALLMTTCAPALTSRHSLLQLLRAIGFLNKHGFAHLDIKNENIVIEPLPDEAIDRLFLPLGQVVASGCSDYDDIGLAQRLQVTFTAATVATLPHTFSQAHVIDFGHAAHVLHFSRQLHDPKTLSLAEHCPTGYSAPEAGEFCPGQCCCDASASHTCVCVFVCVCLCVYVCMHFGQIFPRTPSYIL